MDGNFLEKKKKLQRTSNIFLLNQMPIHSAFSFYLHLLSYTFIYMYLDFCCLIPILLFDTYFFKIGPGSRKIYSFQLLFQRAGRSLHWAEFLSVNTDFIFL